MSAQSIREQASLPLQAGTSGKRSISWWAMVIVILNEVIIFATLLSGYFYIRSHSPVWPQDGYQRPELVIPVLMTGLLVLSSVFIQVGSSGIRKGSQGLLKACLAMAMIPAIAFLILQAYAYSISEFGPRANTYASLFYTITSIYAAHVCVAILMNIYIQIRTWVGHFNAERYQAVENVALYWHFIVVAWLFIVFSLYLSPYF